MYIMDGIIVLFVFLGILFKTGKGSFLIAGYNTMPEDEKKGIDRLRLVKFMGSLMFALAATYSLIAAGIYMNIAWLTTAGIALSLLLPIACVIYVNTGSRFKK